MQRRRVTRRRLLGGVTGSAVVGLAGCLSGGSENSEGDGSTDAGPGDGDGSGGSDSGSGGSSDGDGAGGTATGGGDEATASEPAARDCSPLLGDPTPLPTTDTQFVFNANYPESWTDEGSRIGSNSRLHYLKSPAVYVDGAPEKATLSITQHFEALTQSDVDAEVAELTEGDYARFEVLGEVDFGGEAVTLVGFPDVEAPTYVLWLPYGEGEAKYYYQLELTWFSTIIGETEESNTDNLCTSEIRAALDMLYQSLEPNPTSVIEDAN